MSISVAIGCEERVTSDGQQFRYYDVGTGDVTVVCLHGLFGSPDNWQSIMRDLGDHYRFLALQLPIEPGPGRDRSHTKFRALGQITRYVEGFFDAMGLDRAVVVGNSLGGQVGLDFYIHNPERVERLVLCGSAGLFEKSLTGGRPPRVCRDFIREQANGIFHDPAHVTEQLIDDIYDMLSDRSYRRFILRVAKATRDRYMFEELSKVSVKTMIIWGREDTITPPFVAEQFCENIPNAKLVFIDNCGHAPPIEQPDEFANHLHGFLGDMTSSQSPLPCNPR